MRILSDKTLRFSFTPKVKDEIKKRPYCVVDLTNTRCIISTPDIHTKQFSLSEVQYEECKYFLNEHFRQMVFIAYIKTNSERVYFNTYGDSLNFFDATKFNVGDFKYVYDLMTKNANPEDIVFIPFEKIKHEESAKGNSLKAEEGSISSIARRGGLAQAFAESGARTTRRTVSRLNNGIAENHYQPRAFQIDMDAYSPVATASVDPDEFRRGLLNQMSRFRASVTTESETPTPTPVSSVDFFQ